jgi:hypothetical protein
MVSAEYCNNTSTTKNKQVTFNFVFKLNFEFESKFYGNTKFCLFPWSKFIKHKLSVSASPLTKEIQLGHFQILATLYLFMEVERKAAV